MSFQESPRAQPRHDTRSTSDDEASWQDDASEYEVHLPWSSNSEDDDTQDALLTQPGSPKIRFPPAAIREYLDDGTSCLRDSESLQKVMSRAVTIVQKCDVSPRQAFYYCVDHPQGSPDHYLHLKRSMNLAFELEGLRIMHMLEDDDREKLRETPLEDVAKLYKEEGPSTLVLEELRMHVDEVIAQKILRNGISDGKITIGCNAVETATNLLTEWKLDDSLAQKKKQWEEAFEKHGLKLRRVFPLFDKLQYELDDKELDISIAMETIVYFPGRPLKFKWACAQHIQSCVQEGNLSPEEILYDLRRYINDY